MNNSNRIKVGVIGVGHLGNFHVQQLKTIPEADVVGIFDQDAGRLAEMADEHSVKAYSDYMDLLKDCQAVSIVTPTNTHFDVARSALDQNCHVFIEKPITQTVEQAKQLLEMAQARGKLIQVGHIEQFNPAFLALGDRKINPKFIECHRLAPFNARGTDVPVVLDLMIHDIGIILSLVPDRIRDIRASGVKVVSDSVDIANARIEFENGCIANITSSRISQKTMRKLRIFQENAYITVDFHTGTVETYDVSESEPAAAENSMVFTIEGKRKKHILYQKPFVEKGNALRMELAHFLNAIRESLRPAVDGHSATEALEVAIRIQNSIDG